MAELSLSDDESPARAEKGGPDASQRIGELLAAQPPPIDRRLQDELALEVPAPAAQVGYGIAGESGGAPPCSITAHSSSRGGSPLATLDLGRPLSPPSNRQTSGTPSLISVSARRTASASARSPSPSSR